MEEFYKLTPERALTIHAFLNGIEQGHEKDIAFAKKFQDMYFKAHKFDDFLRRNKIEVVE